MQTHIVAKTLVFNERGELLLIRRSTTDSHRPGEPDLPGGQVEAGEEILAGAVREAYEETGLTLDPKQMQLVYAETRIGLKKDINQHINFVKLIYATKVGDQAIQLSVEHDQHTWHKPDQLPDDPTYHKYITLTTYLRDNDIAADLWRV